MEMCFWDDGRSPKMGEIIEIGVSEVDLDNLCISKRAQYLVKPDVDKISPECTLLTGHTQKKIDKHGRPLDEVIRSMIKSFGGLKSIYASWGRDDLYLFNECKNKGIDAPFQEHINISLIHNMRVKSVGFSVGMKDALSHYNLELDGTHHSAYWDSYNLAKIYIAMNKEGAHV